MDVSVLLKICWSGKLIGGILNQPNDGWNNIFNKMFVQNG